MCNQSKIKPIIGSDWNQKRKREERARVLRQWLMTDGNYDGKRYSESEIRQLLTLPRHDHYAIALHHGKALALREYSLRAADDDSPITFEEVSYLDIIKSRENLTRISADLYANQDRLARLIEQVEGDIERLSKQDRVSTELAETKKLLTSLIKEQASLYRDLERMERNRSNLSQKILEQQRKLNKDKRSVAAEDKTPTAISIDLGSVT